MNTEHMKWMQTTEITNLKDYIMQEKTGTFVNIKEKVDEYLCEIIRFLILKSIHQDFKASLLSPLSKEIDDVWHCFLLHTEEYLSFVNKMTLEYCEQAHFIHHNPKGAFEEGPRMERLERTKLVYKSRYNKLPSVCNLSSHNNKRKRESNEDVNTHFVEKKKESSPNVPITLIFRDQRGGDEISLKLRRCTHFQKVIDKYLLIKGVEHGGFIFMFDGMLLGSQGKTTPSDYDMEDEDVIDVIPNEIGC